MTDFILIQEDALSRNHPIFKKAPQDASAIFIFDTDYLAQTKYSLKRIQFLFEAAMDADLNIYKGKTVDILKDLTPDKLYITESVNPWLRDALSDQKFTIEWVPDEPFVDIKNDDIDLKRFFRYWNSAKKQLMTKDDMPLFNYEASGSK